MEFLQKKLSMQESVLKTLARGGEDSTSKEREEESPNEPARSSHPKNEALALADIGVVLRRNHKQQEAGKDVLLSDSSMEEFFRFKPTFERYLQELGPDARHISTFIPVAVRPGLYRRIQLSRADFDKLSNAKALERLTEFQNGKVDSPISMMLQSVRMGETEHFNRKKTGRLYGCSDRCYGKLSH